MDDDFRIRVGPERMAGRLQFGSQLFEVVDFTVEDHPDGLRLVGHRLMTASQIDDGKPSESEPNGARQEEPLIVWSTVDQGPRHALDVVKLDGHRLPKIQLAANTAHPRSTPPSG